MPSRAATHDQLFVTLYAELRRLAQRELRRHPAATLSATTLLHEAFLSVSVRDDVHFAGRGQFMAYAARAMRGLTINYVRDRRAQKRGGACEITALCTDAGADLPIAVADAEGLEEIGVALECLAQIEPRLAECVDLKFFCGYSHADIAALWGVSERTVRREWDKARLALHRLLAASATGQ
jgi:RNA polymerase sigma factor (TIGR02999 family)